MVRDRAHVAELLDRCRFAHVRSAFVVGGDAKDRGEIHDGLALIRLMEDLSSVHVDRRARLPRGSPGDPERCAHRFLGQAGARRPRDHPDGLRSRYQARGSHGCAMKASRSLCTSGSPGRRRWGSSRRWAPGSGSPARCGTCGRTGAQGHVLKRSFGPDALLEALAPTLADPTADVRAFALFTFNQVEETVAVAATVAGRAQAGRGQQPVDHVAGERWPDEDARRSLVALMEDHLRLTEQRLRTHPGVHRLRMEIQPALGGSASRPSASSNTIRFALTSRIERWRPASASSSSRTIVGAVSSARRRATRRGRATGRHDPHALTAFSPGAANGNSSGRRARRPARGRSARSAVMSSPPGRRRRGTTSAAIVPPGSGAKTVWPWRSRPRSTIASAIGRSSDGLRYDDVT